MFRFICFLLIFSFLLQTNQKSSTAQAFVNMMMLTSKSEFLTKTLGGTNSTENGQAIFVSGSYIYIVGAYYNNTTNSNSVLDFAGSTLNGKTATATEDVFVAKLNMSGTVVWTKTMGGTGSDRAFAVQTDASGNVYVGGRFTNNSSNGSGVLDFNSAALNGKSTTSGLDAFVAKLDSDGNQLWISALGGTAAEVVSDLSIDSSANVYLAGSFGNSSSNSNLVLDFAGNTLNGKNAAVSTDGFVIKLNTSGVQQWVRIIGGQSTDLVNSISVDSSGNLYCVGYFLNDSANGYSVTDFSNTILNGIAATASNDVFVVKLDNAGSQQWVKTLGGSGSDIGVAISTQADGTQLFVGGTFTNSSANVNTVIDFASNSLNGKTSTNSIDSFVAKINSTGTQQWIRTMGGTNNDNLNNLAVDAADNVFIGGSFNNNSSNVNSVLDFADVAFNGTTSTTSFDAFAFKLNSSGTQIWGKTLGGTSANDAVRGVSASTADTVFMSGSFTNSSSDANSAKDFKGKSLLGKNSSSNVDIFLAKP